MEDFLSSFKLSAPEPLLGYVGQCIGQPSKDDLRGKDDRQYWEWLKELDFEEVKNIGVAWRRMKGTSDVIWSSDIEFDYLCATVRYASSVVGDKDADTALQAYGVLRDLQTKLRRWSGYSEVHSDWPELGKKGVALYVHTCLVLAHLLVIKNMDAGRQKAGLLRALSELDPDIDSNDEDDEDDEIDSTARDFFEKSAGNVLMEAIKSELMVVCSHIHFEDARLAEAVACAEHGLKTFKEFRVKMASTSFKLDSLLNGLEVASGKYAFVAQRTGTQRKKFNTDMLFPSITLPRGACDKGASPP